MAVEVWSVTPGSGDSCCLLVDLASKEKVAQAAEIMGRLEQACDEMMTEFISKKHAANWGIINSAMYDSARFRALLKQAETVNHASRFVVSTDNLGYPALRDVKTGEVIDESGMTKVEAEAYLEAKRKEVGP